VRLVFCLYAESSGIFKHKIFRDYLNGARNIRRDLLDLFEVLNTKETERDPYLDETLQKFPFVNGGLFADSIEIPNFTPEIKKILLEEASSGFNWAGISPTIFGAVFESTLNPVTRRAGGMHYTSLENIHKVIDPLFLDDLNEEFLLLKTSTRNKKKNLLAFQEKLASIKIFDPACGSGNFLTESYLSLRRLENNLLKELFGGQIQLGEFVNPIKVSIGQFYGIEINDFAVSVAQTALWIAELQMIQETREIIHRNLNFLPLKSYANIHEGNALKLDWKKILVPSPQSLVPTYIIGNPPFVGMKYQNAAQKADLIALDKRLKPLDYVAGWYFKANDFMKNSKTRAAFVSTNSISQGEQVGTLWNILDVKIDFAYRTFIWDSESTDKAHVHCVIVGFSNSQNHFDKPKIIFDGDEKIFAQNINGYLLDFDNVFVEKHNEPLSIDVPKMTSGNRLTDNGNFLFTREEREEFIRKEPAAAKFIRMCIGGKDFIDCKPRYCLYLKDCSPAELRKMPLVMKKIKNVREYRLKSRSESTRKAADNPSLFQKFVNQKTNFIFIPQVSSENRKYIPIGFINPEIIGLDPNFMIPDAQIYHFGVLTSSIHMIWTKTVCGRLKSDYRYSATIVYNNFVWCTPTEAQKKLIEQTAQTILDVRAKYPDSTLADLYDELTMPADLRAAHKKNDLAVAKAYGFEKILDNERFIVAELFNLYKNLAN